MGEADAEKYFYVDGADGLWCFSNTMLVLLYTAISFLSICFWVIGKQLIYSKRN